MNKDVKKETSTTPTKAQVEVQNRKKKKSFSLKEYHKKEDLSSPVASKNLKENV